MQAGTETIDWAGTPVTSFWYDDYANVSGYNNKAKPVYTPVIHQGDSVYVEATYNGNNTMTVFCQNYTTTNSTNMTVQTLYVDQSSADFINEPQPAKWDFPNFGTVPDNGYAGGAWGSNYAMSKYQSDSVTLGKFTAYKLGGDTCGNLVAWPTGIDSYGNWTDYATANDGC